jgi:putative transposase
MAHSYVCVRLHLVWATYRRQPWIAPEWRDRLYRYLAAVARRKGAWIICAGGVRDHIHLYIALSASLSIAQLVNALKANSSRWIHETFPRHRLFAWQTGYAAFSVYKPDEARLIAYIGNQEAHHRRKNFERELVHLLERHEIPYDERSLAG